ncbi:MAG: hypothetical protein AB2637_18380 [Candidatus Thiodiazotropha sp.]|nr:hypothetical protein [Candidatus Thiodiazotropha taylori]MBV2093807.1 hypothetical protein [Candidatus Thiodiazotropha sp. (ex Codakia orbicularis)]PUB73904.1 MAG: hypothetical protein DBP03_11005 [gamma proteobacterium symbiont of Ctena orbiculata]
MNRDKLILLIPDLFWPTKVQRLEGLRVPPFLARLKSQAKGSDESRVGGLSETLFGLFGFEAGGDDFPEGAVSYYGEGGEPGTHCWAYAPPVHFIADKDKLYLVDSTQLNITEDEAENLVAIFNTHFKQDNLSLVFKQPNAWYLKLPVCPKIKTRSLESVVGCDVGEHLPQGEEQMNWLQVINETQMLFHSSDVNQSRNSEGKLAVNGLWPAGFGSLPKIKTDIDVIYSSHILAKGLSRIANITRCETPAGIDEIGLNHKKTIAVFTDFQVSKSEVELEKWYDSARLLHEGLLRLVDKMDGKAKKDIVILDCTGGVYNVGRRVLRAGIWSKLWF